MAYSNRQLIFPFSNSALVLSNCPWQLWYGTQQGGSISTHVHGEVEHRQRNMVTPEGDLVSHSLVKTSQVGTWLPFIGLNRSHGHNSNFRGVGTAILLLLWVRGQGVKTLVTGTPQ